MCVMTDGLLPLSDSACIPSECPSLSKIFTFTLSTCVSVTTLYFQSFYKETCSLISPHQCLPPPSPSAHDSQTDHIVQFVRASLLQCRFQMPHHGLRGPCSSTPLGDSPLLTELQHPWLSFLCFNPLHSPLPEGLAFSACAFLRVLLHSQCLPSPLD